MVRKKINSNVHFNYVKDSKFKSNRISVHIISELDNVNTSHNALLSFVLRKSNHLYSDFQKFTRKLYSLYGASFDCDIDKVGNNHIVSFSLQSIDDRFSIYGENVLKESSTFLFETVLNPNFNNGFFEETSVNVEKEKLVETIESIFNNKRSYVVKKAKDILYKGSNISISRYGDIDIINKIDIKSLTEAYDNLIKNSKIEIMLIGCGDDNAVYDEASKYFKGLNVNHVSIRDFNANYQNFNYIKEVETIDIVQDKICLLFTGFKSDDLHSTNVMRLGNTILGGSPFSKLFLNVREKQSLCYYCDSSYDRFTEVMAVDCGLDNYNVKIAIDTIHEQINSMKSGNISDEELNKSKLYIRNYFTNLKDKLVSLESFYLSQVILDTNYSIESIIDDVLNINKDDIKNAFSNCQSKVLYHLSVKGD